MPKPDKPMPEGADNEVVQPAAPVDEREAEVLPQPGLDDTQVVILSNELPAEEPDSPSDEDSQAEKPLSGPTVPTSKRADHAVSSVGCVGPAAAVQFIDASSPVTISPDFAGGPSTDRVQTGHGITTHVHTGPKVLSPEERSEFMRPAVEIGPPLSGKRARGGEPRMVQIDTKQLPCLLLTHELCLDLRVAAYMLGHEVTFFAKPYLLDREPYKGDVLAKRLHIPHQDAYVRGGRPFTDVTDQQLAKFTRSGEIQTWCQKEPGYDIEVGAGWIHLHPSGNVNPSSDDEEEMADAIMADVCFRLIFGPTEPRHTVHIRDNEHGFQPDRRDPDTYVDTLGLGLRVRADIYFGGRNIQVEGAKVGLFDPRPDERYQAMERAIMERVTVKQGEPPDKRKRAQGLRA